MHRSLIQLASFVLVILLFGCGEENGQTSSLLTNPVRTGNSALRVEGLTISELEARVDEIDRQLELLCPISLRSGVGAVGGRSALGLEKFRKESFRIELSKPERIDQVVLVPSIWRDTKMGLRADGFPLEFQIVVGTDEEPEGKVVASFTEADKLLPRIAPLVVHCGSVVGSWVRVEASVLTARIWDSQYVFQLAEIMVLSGQENVALRRRVKPSSTGAFQTKYLVDGVVPYLMDSKVGEKSIAFLKQGGIEAAPEITLDLGVEKAINRIHLHAVDLSDSVPQSIIDGFGLPRKLVVEVAKQHDFSDAVEVLKIELHGVYDYGPIIIRNFEEHSCRYVRLTATHPETFKRSKKILARIGFAEIELFSEGKNVALGVPVKANFPESSDPSRKLAALTDGHNFYGKILPIRRWINGLARRHDLETQRPLVVAELNRRYELQSSRLAWVTRLAVLLAFGIGVSIFVNRVVRTRQLTKMRERFAADLHDELGANVHVIGILSDLAQDAVESPEKLREIHQRIRVMTERSGAAVQHCTNILDANGICQNLYENMQRTTDRVMAGVTGELTFHGNLEFLERLKPRKRADLFLFYKECLVNISRHSEATKFSAQLSALDDELKLIVRDNGIGLAKTCNHRVPPSLVRRSRLLGASVNAIDLQEGGTQIGLSLRSLKWLGRPWKSGSEQKTVDLLD